MAYQVVHLLMSKKEIPNEKMADGTDTGEKTQTVEVEAEMKFYIGFKNRIKTGNI